MSSRVLVTGGAGFVGANLTRRLAEEGHRVRVLDNFSTGRRANLADLESDVEVLEHDLRSTNAVMRAARGIELIFHQGALPSVPRSLKDPLTTNAVNVSGTLNVLLAAQHHEARRVVLASSSSIYGNRGTLPRVEAANPEPRSPYAVSKLAAEQYCASFADAFGLETVALRYFNVYGPGQDPMSEYAAVVPRFIAALASRRPITVYGDGEQTRDFTYISDVVQATILAGDCAAASGVINVAGGVPISVNTLAERVGATLGLPVSKINRPARAGEVRYATADLTRAKRVLRFEASMPLERGLELTASALLGSGLLAASVA